MSKLEVDAIEPQSGTTLTIGASGDSVNIASGATITDFTSTGIDDNATSTAITIDSSENVGIGTSSPSQKLDVINPNQQIHFGSATTGGGYLMSTVDAQFRLSGGTLFNGSSWVAKATEAGIVAHDGSTDGLKFYVNTGLTSGNTFTPTERMRINSSGRLLLNTTSFSGGATIGFQINATSTSSGAYAQLIKNNSGTEIFQMRCNGGLANYSSSNVNLSDEREKKNIEDMHSSWNDVKNWSLRKYHYKSDEDTDDKRYGVVAQEIEKITPELVTVFNKSSEILWQEGEELPEGVSVGDVKTEAIERKGVHEQQMFWTAIKSLQEAMERIETLEAKNTELEARITALENK